MGEVNEKTLDKWVANAKTCMCNENKAICDCKPQKDSRVFETGAIRDSNHGKPFVHNILGYTRLRYGYHSNMGSTKYGDGNFKLGIPTDVALESLDRHLAKFKRNIEKGLPQDEDHLSAMIFNIQLCMMNEDKAGISEDHYYNLKNNNGKK